MSVLASALVCAFLPKSVYDTVIHLSKSNLLKKISAYIVVQFAFHVNNNFGQLTYKPNNNNV